MDEWPWHWARLHGYVNRVKNVYQQAAYDEDKKSAVPPRWMFWDSDEVEAWFEERKKAREDSKKKR